jgi:hypothetical protein
LFFANENFQRDKKYLLSNMCSVTAEGKRRKDAAAQEQRRLSAQQSIANMAVGSQILPPQLQGQVRCSSAVHELDTKIPFHVVSSSTPSFATVKLQRLLQKQELAHAAQAKLLHLLVSRQASLQQTETNASTGQLSVASLAAYISAESVLQHPQTQLVPQEEPLRRLLNILNQDAREYQFNSLPFPPYARLKPF